MEDCFVYNTTNEFDLLQKPSDNYPHLQVFSFCLKSNIYSQEK